jgi:hypothetical protein
MNPDTRVTEKPRSARPSASPPRTLKVLIVSATLEPGQRFPAPVDFANALSEAGARVWLAAAVGPRRTGLSRAVGYLLIDDAGSAPVKTAHELMRLIHHHQPDVVHAHGARCALVAAVAVKASRTKCARVMTHYSPGFKRFPNWIKGPVLRNVADRFFAANETLAKELEALGVAAERIRVEPIDDKHAAQFARNAIALYRKLVDPSEFEAK